MDISEISVKLESQPVQQDGRGVRVLAYLSYLIDNAICVRDTRLLATPSGGKLLAMPCRKVAAPCPSCARKNHLLANFCNYCGARLPAIDPQVSPEVRKLLFADVIFPVSQEARKFLEQQLIGAYEKEIQ